MNATSDSRRSRLTRIRWFAWSAIAVGAVALFLALGLDWDGFGGGFVQGAALALLMAGFYFLGFTGGVSRGSTWLPSRGAAE
jgi:hypothetical protein